MKQLSANPVIRFPSNCPVLEVFTTRNVDLCFKDKLEDSDLDTLGVAHVSRHCQEHDFVGVNDSWMD